MNYAEILKAIKAYNAMTPEDVQETIKPIIKSWDIEFLAERLNITSGAIYQMNKKCYVARGMKPTFEHYASLMNLGVNPEHKKKEDKRKEKIRAKIAELEKKLENIR